MGKKTLFAIGVIAVGAAVTGFVATRDQDERLEVEVEPVSRREIVQTVEATGRIQPKTQVNISADVSAKITRLLVEEGEWVEKDQLLLELDRERYVAAVESAEANLRSVEANARLAEENMKKAVKDHERTTELFSQQLESPAALDASFAAAEVEKARHRSVLDQVEQARAALKQARDDLSKTTIYAPMSGTVSRLNKEEGEIALGSQFQEDVILEIANLEGMEALVEVDENDIVHVAVGDTATIEVDALLDRPFTGVVTEIASSAKISGQGTTEEKTEFEVKIAVEGPGTDLRPGMTASAEIVTDVRDEAIGVPIQCVTVRTPEQLGLEEDGVTTDRDGFVQAVFVVSDGVASVRPVTTGIQSASHIEIVEGLETGESVVVGSFRAISKDLTDGADVRSPDAG